MNDPGDSTVEHFVGSPQALCKACGLCCRGVWHSHGALETGEVPLAQQAGMALVVVDGSVSFQQPCVLHRNERCSAYETWRPKVCSNYSCALLDQFVAGSISFREALIHVKAARGMADRLQNEAGPSDGGLRGKVFLSRLTDSPEFENFALAPLSPEARLDVVALRIYFKKYFKKKKD